MKKIQAVKGTGDILPEEIPYWNHIERVVRDTMRLFNYRELRTPIFEETGLFARSIGEDTDIVGKEMYTFTDMGDRSITLRPEGTAPVVRAFIEHSLDQRGLPRKLWYMGPMFRQEKPQKGRQRQFHQFGVEAIGSSSPMIDAEVMNLFDTIAEKLGLKDRVFTLNCLGGNESRKAYIKALTGFLDTIGDRLCDDCQRRRTTNPLRVLDCKVPGCREALDNNPELPKIIDFLMEKDRKNFSEVQSCLHDLGVRYKIDYSCVRGLDYYTGTVFELKCKGLGAQSTVVAGGRYDNLIRELGGPDLPAVGFGCGMERLILALKANTADGINEETFDVYVINPVPDSYSVALKTRVLIQKSGFSADMDSLGRSMKAQMKAAAKNNVKYAVIIESEKNMVSVRDMEKSTQKKMSIDQCIERLEKESVEKIKAEKIELDKE